MGASAYVGRVGGLAVALGVGVAVATGNGVASASPSTTGSSPSDTSTSADTSAPAKTSTTESSTKVDTDGLEPKGQVEPTPAAEPETKAAGSEADDVDDAKDAPPTRKSHKPKNVQIRIAKKPATDLTKKSSVSEAPPTSALATTAPVSDTSDEQPVVQRTMAAPEPVTFTDVAVVAIQEVRPKVATTSRPSFVQRAVSSIVSQVLSAVGLGSLASNAPGGPSWSPLGLALLALGARRETEQTLAAVRTTSTGTPAAALALVPTAAVTSEPATTRTPVAVSGNTQFIEFVTGAGNLNDTQKRFGIGGTDLGIMWDNGIADDPATEVNEHQVLIAFGDTFSSSFPVRSGIWRMNTLFRSTDTTLSNGMYIPDGIPHDPGMYSGSPMSDPNFSREIIGHPRYAIGPEVTIIPTAAISVPGAGANGATRQYISFMSVRSWDTPGSWTTNYSGIAYSDDNGQNWRSELVPSSSIRTAASGRSTVPYVSGNQNFQQNAFVKPPAGSQEAAEGWVYMYGTPSGRNGTVYVSRVNQYQIMDQTKYQYWNGSSWVANKPSAAKPILPGTTTSFYGFFKSTTYPSAGEMSVQYNPYLKKYVMLYADKNNNVVMRTSNTPQGTWSAPTALVTSTKVPGLYAPMIHPWSGTADLPQSESQYLYWNLSTWGDYQVRLMRTDLTKV
ncbi:hypothetical protein A5724_13440 [Mycobacterium sp. ACS1612]|nr:hypothetical protein A5724_13440 [Mycobacterium sp. ACS1612]